MPRAASTAARPRDSAMSSAPGATRGPSGVWITPMTRASATACAAGDALVSNVTVILLIVRHGLCQSVRGRKARALFAETRLGKAAPV
jgi:hypothetical protein